jgi:hypothetical protein
MPETKKPLVANEGELSYTENHGVVTEIHRGFFSLLACNSPVVPCQPNQSLKQQQIIAA